MSTRYIYIHFGHYMANPNAFNKFIWFHFLFSVFILSNSMINSVIIYLYVLVQLYP